MMLAVFGRVWAVPGVQTVSEGDGPTADAEGGTAATPFVTITRRDGREWVLTMDEVDHLIDTLTRLRKQYRREVGK